MPMLGYFNKIVCNVLGFWTSDNEQSIIADKSTMLSESGAKTVVVPMDNLAELTNVPASVLGNTDVPFDQNNQMLMQKKNLLD